MVYPWLFDWLRSIKYRTIKQTEIIQRVSPWQCQATKTSCNAAESQLYVQIEDLQRRRAKTHNFCNAWTLLFGHFWWGSGCESANPLTYSRGQGSGLFLSWRLTSQKFHNTRLKISHQHCFCDPLGGLLLSLFHHSPRAFESRWRIMSSGGENVASPVVALLWRALLLLLRIAAVVAVTVVLIGCTLGFFFKVRK